MDAPKLWVAEMLTKEIRFMVALRIVRQIEFGSRSSYDLDTLFSLFESSDENVNFEYRTVLYEALPPSLKKKKRIRALFMMVYQDEKAMLEWMNRKITFRYYRRAEAKKFNSVADSAIKSMLNDILIDELKM